MEETSIKESNEKLKLFKDDFSSEDKIEAAVVSWNISQDLMNSARSPTKQARISRILIPTYPNIQNEMTNILNETLSC